MLVFILMSWVELHSIFEVDEKDERAYTDPGDTIFNALLGNSLMSSFPGAHLPLLVARY